MRWVLRNVGKYLSRKWDHASCVQEQVNTLGIECSI